MPLTMFASLIRVGQRFARQFGVGTILSLGFLLMFASASPGDPPGVSVDATIDSDKPKESVATLAGGCFWCTEAVFERMNGVNDVVSGYIGGHVENPTYTDVVSKRSGHAEAVEVYYDPEKISYVELLEIFFKTHDPTSLNRQGADEGPQYRSSIFYHDEKERLAAKRYIKKLDASGIFDSPIVTKLEPATKFYPAEEYHQDYFRLNPGADYCQYVVRSKVIKAKQEFPDKLKESAVRKKNE